MEDARAKLVARPDPVSTAGGGSLPPCSTSSGPPPNERFDCRSKRRSTETRAAGGSLLKRIRSHLLHEEVSTNPEEKLDPGTFFMDDRTLLWHAPAGKRKPVLAIYRALVSDIISLVHGMRGYPGMTSTLVLLGECFHSPTIARDVRENVLSCGVWKHKRSTSQRTDIL